MDKKDITNGITPTPEYIATQHTGKLIDLLPDTYMIKGGKNERGFEQGYAIKKRNKKQVVLIDVVDLASREAVLELQKEGFEIQAILITGEGVLRDAYDNLEVLSKDAGGAAIYLHPSLSVQGNYHPKDITGTGELLQNFDLRIREIPATHGGAVLIFSSQNGGMLFPGDSVWGSAYDTEEFTFTRLKLITKKKEFEASTAWGSLSDTFSYLFPRKGKPAVKIDGGTRTDIINKLSRGGPENG